MACPAPSHSPYFVPGLPHVILLELSQALISYQDYHMLLLSLAGLLGHLAQLPAQSLGRVVAERTHWLGHWRPGQQVVEQLGQTRRDAWQVEALPAWALWEPATFADWTTQNRRRHRRRPRPVKIRPVKALFFRPIPPSFLVLARARLWCLGARMWRVNLPWYVKSIPK